MAIYNTPSDAANTAVRSFLTKLGEEQKIRSHMTKWDYPKLTSDEMNAIRAIARSLYDGIRNEVDKSVLLYRELDRTLIQGRGSKTEIS